MAKKEPFNLRIIIATRKPLLISIGLILVGIILLATLVIPQAQETFNLINQINAQKPKTTELKKKLASLENISANAEYAQVDIVEKALPSKKPLLELLKSLSLVSQSSGAEISKFQLSPGLVATDVAQLQKAAGSKNANYDDLEVTLKVIGTFKQIQDFLIQVEKVSPFTTVTEVQLNGQVDRSTLSDTQTKFQADIKTSTYFFTQPISVRVETPLPLIGEKERTVLSSLAAFVPTNLDNQTQVLGGGLEDLFGVKSFEDENQVETAIQKNTNLQATPTPTPRTQTSTTTQSSTTQGTTNQSTTATPTGAL